MASPQPSWALGIPGPDTPATPRTMRTLRKIRSHQVLSTSSALIAQTQAAQQASPHDTQPESAAVLGGTTRVRAHRRTRSNSDAASRASRETTATPPATQRRPARKTGSGIGVKRSLLENFLRDGPQNDDLNEGLRELKYLVLSCRVDADGDGMVRDTQVYNVRILSNTLNALVAVPNIPLANTP